MVRFNDNTGIVESPGQWTKPIQFGGFSEFPTQIYQIIQIYHTMK